MSRQRERLDFSSVFFERHTDLGYLLFIIYLHPNSIAALEAERLLAEEEADAQ